MLAIAELAALQAADLRLDGFKQQLHDLAAAPSEPPGAAALEAELAAQRALLQQAQRARQTSEAEAQAIADKIKQEETKLYGGVIRDPKELRALQQEVFGLRQRLRAQEDDALARLAEEEAAQEATSFLERLQTACAADWARRRAEQRGETERLTRVAAEIAQEIARQRAEIDASDLTLYDRHRQRMAVAIVQVVGGACGGCRLTLPLSVITRARRRAEAVTCPACQRIIYVP